MTDTATTDRSASLPSGEAEHRRSLAVGELIEQLMGLGHDADRADEPHTASSAWALAYLLDASQLHRAQLASLLATQAKLEALYERMAPLADQIAAGGITGLFGLLKAGGGIAQR